MQYRILGKTGLKVSVIGFGAWAIGGNMWGPQDDNDSIEALNTAIDLGVNFIDTALAYGNGHSENLVGKVVKQRKEKVYIATKIPPVIWAPPVNGRMQEAFPKDKIISSVEQSLKNLGVDCIDLIQLHSWRDSWTNEEYWHEIMSDLKQKGKIRFVGVSVHDNCEDEVLRLLDTGKIDTVQVVYNVLAQTPKKNLLPKAGKSNVGIIARVPLAYGALTGKFTKETIFPENDFRAKKYFGKNLNELLEKVDNFKRIVGSTQKEDLIAAAIQFSLLPKEVSVSIPGIRTKSQAIENCTIFDSGKIFASSVLEDLSHFTVQKSF